MAFENGYKAESYVKECMEKYKNDKLIFSKAMQIIDFFSHQESWPHNYFKLENVMEIVLGQRLEDILQFAAQYLLAEKRDGMKKIEWPDYTPLNFKSDIAAFFYTVSDGIEKAKYGRENPLRYYGIARSISAGSNTKVLKFMRIDGASLDIAVTRADIESIINTLGKMTQDSRELDEER